MLEITVLPVLTDNYIFVIHDPKSTETAVVDPALAEPVLKILAENNWSLNYIFNTHHHHDHIDGNQQLKQATGCQVIAPLREQNKIPNIDRPVMENDTIYLGRHCFRVLETPGHTLGHVVFYCAEQQILFCGDTLFAMGCGRLFEGTAEQLWQSLQKLKALPQETQVYCAHEYTQANGRFALTIDPDNQALIARMRNINQRRANRQATIPTTIAEELATNPFLREQSPDIQKHLQMQECAAVKVFTEIRRLKDTFV